MYCCKIKGWSLLCLIGATVLFVWTVVLPWISSRPTIRSHIDQLNRQGIDPAALYYTDLEAMGRLESNIADIRQAHPDAFWKVRGMSKRQR